MLLAARVAPQIVQPMLFHSSIRKELARSFGATLIVLATVVMTMTLIRTLGQASRGSFNPSDVMLVMGYTVLAYMPTILTMSLFISIMAALSRMYRDSEMVIWFSSGQGLAGLLGPMFRFAWPVLAAIAALALLVLPWSNQRIDDMKLQYERRGDLERIEPGQFQESAGGKRVFFVEKDLLNPQAGSSVFIATTEDGKQTTTSARRGRVETIGKDRFLMLSNGQRLENEIGDQSLRISEFEEYGSKVGVDVFDGDGPLEIDTSPTLDLLKNPTLLNQAELSWRFGLILAAINFLVISVAISGGNPRVGRSANLVFAMFAFILYYNLLGLGQSWISSGRYGLAPLMLTLHGGTFVLAILWLSKVHNNWHWRRRAVRRPSVPSQNVSAS